MNDSEYIQQQDESIDIHEYLRVLMRRKWIIITFFVVTVTTVTVGSFIMTPIYRATATLLIDKPAQDVVAISNENAVLAGSDYMAYREYYQTQLEVIKSRSIAKQVFADLDLESNPDFSRAVDPIEAFIKRIKVEPLRDTRLARVSFEDKDKELATRIVNYIATVYTQRNLAYIATSENLNLLKNEYIKLQSKYSEFSKRYKDKHPKMIRLRQELEQMSERIAREAQEGASSVPTSVRANNVKIVDLADVPVKPIKPKKRLNVLLSAIVGLFGGVGLAFLFENMDNTLKSPEDIERYVKMPFLGYVPSIISKNGEYTDAARDRIVQIEPRSNVSEAYRSIRTSVVCSVPEEKRLRTIVISSPNPQEGKTITLCNLGIAMANAGERVLLVDTDLRKPRVHKAFDFGNKFGLTDFLTRNADFDAIIKRTALDNLYIVPSGAHPPNPAELLGTKKMRLFLEKAAEQFDRVFLDSPPVTPFTDAALLARISDGFILVVRSGDTRRTIIPRTKQILSDVNANVIGVIINNVLHRKHGYYYYYPYYRRYYYDSQLKEEEEDV